MQDIQVAAEREGFKIGNMTPPVWSWQKGAKEGSRKPGFVIELRRVRLVKKKPYCGNHPPRLRTWGRASSNGAVAADFWERTLEAPGGCWEWQDERTPEGYGRWKAGERLAGTRVASRVAYVLAKGEIPEGFSVLHSCDNPPCCNPAHLFVGTQGDNRADMLAKGRQFNLRGEEAGQAVLTEVQARDILNSYVPRVVTLQHLADRHGVNIKTVHDIVQRKTWRHLEEFTPEEATGCETGGPKMKATYLEWDDWVAFHKIVNDCLDVLMLDADVWSTPQNARGRFWIRKGTQRRTRYDYTETTLYGRPARLWNTGSPDQFA